MSEPLSPATQQWWSYDRSATYDVVGTTVDVPVRDGITIACELRRPARDGAPVEGRFPSVVVEFSPYAVLRDFYVGEADFFAARGHNALVPLLRGVGGSGGTRDHGNFRQAGRHGHDLVEWLATQDFADGRIGMFGESYGGQTSYSTAVERPEHLLAIAPMQSPSSLCHDVVFPGGIKATEHGDIDNWPDVANLTSGGVIDPDAEFAANRAHPTFDAYWRDRSFVDCLAEVTIPVLAVDTDDGGTSTFRQPNAPDDRVDTVTFTSAPLVDDQVLVGHPTLTFRATLDATDAHFYVEPFDVASDDDETLVNDGYLAAGHRRSHTDPEPIVIGETNEYCVAIRTHHHRFRVGNRVRLRISGGAPSRLTPPPAPVRVALETGRTAMLRLPGMGA